MIAYRIQNDIELVRELSGLTIKEIADLTGVSRMTISRWMCGQVQIYREDSVMKQIDEEALHICRFQARVFEISAKITECSSGIFLRRFMCSDTAKRMDTQTFLFESIVPGQVVKEVNDKYSKSSYGSDKYNAEELYWIGYIYRYWCYTYNKSSRQLYRLIKPARLRQLYYPYHSLDPSEAILRIAEADAVNDEDQIRKGVEILRRLNKSAK